MKDRRKFLRMFGISAAGATFAGTLQASKKTINSGGEEAKAEIAKLICQVSIAVFIKEFHNYLSRNF